MIIVYMFFYNKLLSLKEFTKHSDERGSFFFYFYCALNIFENFDLKKTRVVGIFSLMTYTWIKMVKDEEVLMPKARAKKITNWNNLWLRALSVVFLIVLFGASKDIYAQEVTSLGVQSSVKAKAALGKEASATMLNYLKDAGFRISPGKPIDEVKFIFGCFKERRSCMVKVAKHFKTKKMVWGRLKKRRRNYYLRISLLDMETKKIIRERRKLTKKDLDTELDKNVNALMHILIPPAKGMLRLTGTPNAEIFLDGRPIGDIAKQPFELRVQQGRHTISATLDGYKKWEKIIRVDAEATVDLIIQLEAKVDPQKRLALIPKENEEKLSKRTGWRVGFYAASTLTVGLAIALGVNGTKVIDAEDQKTSYLSSSKATNDEARLGCNAPNKSATLSDICDSGNSKATLQNVLIGGITLSALASGFLFYKAYLTGSPDTGGEKLSTFEISPAIMPSGAHLGLKMRF